jgi:polyphosphate kinase
MDIMEIQWKDNVKARAHNADLSNDYRRVRENEAVRSQTEIYNYLQQHLKEAHSKQTHLKDNQSK